MKHKQTLLVLGIFFVTVGATLLAVNWHEHHKATAHPETVAGVKAQLTQAKQSIKNLQRDNATLTAKETEAANEKAALCANLTSHKLTDPLCVKE